MKPALLSLFVSLLWISQSLAFSVSHPSATIRSKAYAVPGSSNNEVLADDNEQSKDQNRRTLFSLATATTLLSNTGLLLSNPQPSLAVSEVLNTMLTRLRNVPVFCIVNTEGIPYMIIKKEERMAKGFAFTSMEGAVIVLSDAQKAAKEGGYADIWADATIVTVPADIAIRLGLQKRERIPSRGNTNLDSVVEIIPTNENRDDGLRIDKRAFKDQGKVPLFYVEALKASDGTMPMFVQKSRLVDTWLAQHPGEALPPIQAIDITYIFEAALRGYEQKIPNGGNVSFVADPEQVKIANDLRSKGLIMYKFDRMIV
ncbi:expressed unknown protein [Seminavis robusta]|uniref:Uncharacterized protein n=1 Tax=Seminavis robusta TaxID=568900 RepID=A0A9N8DQS4_9STRA|nr:expressed unknown protein [Seminavis robusta]|eukprot:Sro282_g107370.1 n/a (314) ;mRNA; r:2886-3827